MKEYLIGLRKWTVIMTIVLMAFVLALLGKLSPEFAQVASVAAGAYTLANAWSKHRKAESDA